MSRPTQDTAHRKRDYLYETFTLCGVTFQTLPILCLQYLFGLLPFRSPLLWKSMFLSFPPPTKMFQFRGLAHLAVCQVFYLTGCPIQISPDRISFANPRSFSQLTTSFFASKSLGIPHTPLYTFFSTHNSSIVPLCRYLISSSMSMNFDRSLDPSGG